MIGSGGLPGRTFLGTVIYSAYYRSAAGWYKKHFDWDTKEEWLVKTPGVVFALAAAVRAFTEEGDSVLIQQPVYYPFSNAVKDNGRQLVNSPLILKDGHYEIDFDDLERKIVQEHVRLFLLCSPHNPVGRVWKEWELMRLGEICLAHDVIVVSDEIHSDFVWEGNTHHVFASLKEEFAEHCVVCTSPAKTFNLAGLQISNIFIPDRTLRRRFRSEISKTGYSMLNTMGVFAGKAAYDSGEDWYAELRQYIQGNIDYMADYIRCEIPKLKLIQPEGTYLMWVDFRELNMTEPQLEDLVENRAGLWLDAGTMFGREGAGFERFNIACPRQTLQNALSRLKTAVDSLG